MQIKLTLEQQFDLETKKATIDKLSREDMIELIIFLMRDCLLKQNQIAVDYAVHKMGIPITDTHLQKFIYNEVESSEN